MSTRVDKPIKVISGMTLHMISAKSRPTLVIWVVHAWKFHTISVKSRPILISVMNISNRFDMFITLIKLVDMFITLIKIGRDFAEIM